LQQPKFQKIRRNFRSVAKKKSPTASGLLILPGATALLFAESLASILGLHLINYGVRGILKTDLRRPLRPMSAQNPSVCPNCGQPLSGTMSFCPVCLFSDMLDDAETDSGEPSSEETLEALPEHRVPRFGHYELLAGEDGKPIELGRGAMGITYKAFDIDLQCPVTLKVFSEKYLGDESARLRFLREARAAASVRHPNVASVFHLGRSGRDYFYAMEFVEGETLASLTKRLGRLEVKLALEITSQVASGLAGIDKQKLVHRDIKPTN
jgi:hypothetical protein